MSFTNAFELITSITGILMSFGYFLQAKKILAHKSAHDISLAQYVIFCVGTVTWTAYGIYTRDMIIVLSFLFGAIGSWLIGTATKHHFYYKFHISATTLQKLLNIYGVYASKFFASSRSKSEIFITKACLVAIPCFFSH